MTEEQTSPAPDEPAETAQEAPAEAPEAAPEAPAAEPEAEAPAEPEVGRRPDFVAEAEAEAGDSD